MPTYLGWTADLLDLARASSDSGLASNHTSGVAHHQDTDKWVGVVVPVDNGLFGVLINKVGLAVLADLSWYSDVGVANLVVDDWNEINASNLGDDIKGLLVLPSLIDKLSTAISVLTKFAS